MNPIARANQYKTIPQVKARIGELEKIKFPVAAVGQKTGKSAHARELRQLKARLKIMESPGFDFGRYEAAPVPSPLLNEL